MSSIRSGLFKGTSNSFHVQNVEGRVNLDPWLLVLVVD